MQLRDIVIGAILAGAIAALAWRARALTRGGAIAAFAAGTLTYASGTIGFTLILLAFFVPSALLSRVGRARKRELVDIGKYGPRDAMQVIANGGVATVCAVAWSFAHDPLWALAFGGAYAAAAADTWGTEIGTLAGRQPRSVLTFRPLATGLSGGVSLPGTLAEVAGALWIGVVAIPAIALAYWFLPIASFGWWISPPASGMLVVLLTLELAVPLGGVAGALVDSVLGAGLQERRYCPRCERACETDPHACGAPTTLQRGIPGFSNDVVNLLATAAGAAVPVLLVVAMLHPLHP